MARLTRRRAEACSAAGLPLVGCWNPVSAAVGRLNRVVVPKADSAMVVVPMADAGMVAVVPEDVREEVTEDAREDVTEDAAAADPSSTTAIASNTMAVRGSGRPSRARC